MTASTTYPCHEAYKKGLTDRKKYPFVASSLYKIREFHGRLESLPDNLINIGKCSVGNKNACNSLRGCVSYDKAFYTKKMPHNIAYNMGFKVVSALPALKYEDLTQHDIDGILPLVALIATQCKLDLLTGLLFVKGLARL